MKSLMPLMWAWIPAILIVCIYILGKLSINTGAIYDSAYKDGYDKGYIQGRLETEDAMRNQAHGCINEDYEVMADCLEELSK